MDFHYFGVSDHSYRRCIVFPHSTAMQRIPSHLIHKSHACFRDSIGQLQAAKLNPLQQVMRGVHQGIQDIKYLLEVAISNAATIPVINAQLKETIDLLHSPQDLIEGGIPE
eukprot:TRINITY_DN1654_c0_g1_i1.p1 TRINITY_DN1654_c0_g1~~TRINITY_DN1654_c0_g1_i1.p1  ORF type:complete len:111 (+),score=21.58 TRINITY_DN1654_c0_g1_i1:358-690(+)